MRVVVFLARSPDGSAVILLPRILEIPLEKSWDVYLDNLIHR